MKTVKLLVLMLTLGAILSACAPAAGQMVNTEYILTTAMRDGEFVFLGINGDINGLVNPALHASPGEKITVMLVNSGEGEHSIAFPELNVHSDTVSKKG